MGAGQEGTEEANGLVLWLLCLQQPPHWPPIHPHPTRPPFVSASLKAQVHPQCYHFKFAFELKYPLLLLCSANLYQPVKDRLFGKSSICLLFISSWHFTQCAV